MKTKLKHFVNVPTNLTDNTIGKTPTTYMIWSPVHHYWLYPDDCKYWESMPKGEKRFLLKQEVVKVSLRNDAPTQIAIFLKDYGKEKNKKLYNKIKIR